MTQKRQGDLESMSGVQFPTPRVRDWMRDLTGLANVIGVIVIGSTARGVARNGSDFDLIIVYRNARPNLREPGEVDARWVDENNLDELSAHADDVVAWGVAYGIPLYDPEGVWGALVSRHQAHIPLPSPDICIKRAERARRYASELMSIGDDEAAREQILTMLTHLARLLLVRRGVFPASRPELVDQLVETGEREFAELLRDALEDKLDSELGLKQASVIIRRGRISKTA